MNIRLPNFVNMILPNLKRKEEAKARLENERLLIDCGSCDVVPGISNIECIRCIVSYVVRFGEPKRILLRTSRDTEFIDDTVEIMNRLAKADVLSHSFSSGKRCSSCSCEPSLMIRKGWETFPEPNNDVPRAILKEHEPETEECEECMISTYRSLEQMDYALKDAERFAARSSFTLTGV